MKHLNTIYVKLCIKNTRLEAFSKRPLDSFVDILELGGERTVILGDAGIGKSTLLLKVVNDWEKGETNLSKFVMVLLLQIQNISSQTKSFAEAIVASLPMCESIGPEDIDNFLKEYPERALILLDGFDEFPVHLHKMMRLDLLAIIKGDKIPNVRVYLTSRSSAMKD